MGRAYPGVPYAMIPEGNTRRCVEEMDKFLRDITRGATAAAGSSSGGGASTSASYITVANEASLTDERRMVTSSPLTGTDGGANTTYTLGLNLAALGASLGGTPALTYGTTVLAGSAITFLRTDDRVKYPTALMSSASSTTFTLSDDTTDQTLTGTLGALKLAASNNSLQFGFWNAAGGSTAVQATSTGTVLYFVAATATVGSTLADGINGTVSLNDASTYSGVTKRGGFFNVQSANVAGATYTNLTLRGAECQVQGVTHTNGTHSWTERTSLNAIVGVPVQSASGVVTVTDTHGIRVSGYPTLGTGGTYTNVRSGRFQFPTVGATIRRGVSVESSSTANLGTEAVDAEGFYCEDIPRGTSTRTNYAFEGATTGTPTTVYGFLQKTAHAVGTTRYGGFLLNTLHAENPSGIAQTTLELLQKNTGATAGAHINFDDKAGDPPAPVTGDLWRNGDALWFRQSAASIDLTAAGGGGDSITVNGAAVTDADLDDATPAAPSGGFNVKWQKDASSPANISAYVDRSLILKQTEIDFGATPVADTSFTVTDADVTASSQLTGWISYEAPTGKDLDEVEMDTIDLKLGPGSGQFTIFAKPMDGYVADKFLVNYTIG